ncbi:MAG: hypothetical protein IPN33_20950 [Saprospiraceae bacterium]|nr:hypothetical protein [Saprospiraceae bacterium]
MHLRRSKTTCANPANRNLKIPELLQLFGNPMMLTLYTGSSSIGLRYHDDSRYRWLPVTTQGELLWNFHEAQLARFIEDVPHDVQEQVWLSFLLRHLLPYIAFRMEKEGRFFIHTRRADNPAFNIKSVIEDAYREWHTENFTDTYPLFEGKRKSLGFGILPDDLDGVQERYVRIRQYLVEKLHLLVAEEGVCVLYTRISGIFWRPAI